MIGMTDVALLDWLGRTLHASEGQSREDSQELYRLIAARLRGEAQQGQAVAWQYRFRHQLPNGGKCRWHECSEEEAKSLERDVYEVRALYTAPPSAPATLPCDVASSARGGTAMNSTRRA